MEKQSWENIVWDSETGRKREMAKLENLRGPETILADKNLLSKSELKYSSCIL